MLDLAGIDYGYRLEAAVGMFPHADAFVRGREFPWTGLIQEQEWTEHRS